MRFRARALKVALLLVAGLAVVGCAVAATRESTAALPVTATSPVTSTATPRAGMTCMPNPSACGFPDATNTGVTPGTQLTPANGVVTLSSPGQVYENKQLTGSLLVTAPNVTIRNVRLINTDPYYAIGVKNGDSWENNDANLLLDHVEINLNGHVDVKGIAFNGFTARHVLFHNGADCSHFGVNVVIEDSLCVLGPDANGDGNPDGNAFCNGPDHFDGFQSDGGRNITLRHNTIRNPCEQTSAILMSTNTSPIDRVVIDHNLVSGGGYTIYCGTDSGGVATHETYTNNVTSREFFPKGGYWGPSTSCENVEVSGGNVWDGNYVPPAGGGAPGGTAGGGSAGAVPGAGTQGAISYLLSKARARKLTRTALARELKRRFTRRAKGMRTRCRRRSRSTVVCTVKWKTRTARRYKGTVSVTRVAANTFRYSLRVKSRSKLVKRTGQVTPSRPGA
jgi:hypothetical protein